MLHPYNCGCSDCAPNQCYECGDFEEHGNFTNVLVDTDPGNPEVGPRPSVETVGVCPTCLPKYAKFVVKDEEPKSCPYCGKDGHNGGCRTQERHDARCL